MTNMNSIFGNTEKIELDGAIKAKDFLNTPFTVKNAKVIFSQKHNDYFTAVETNEGQTFTTWSGVVKEKVEQMQELPQEQWAEITLKVTEKKAQSGYTYQDLIKA